MFEVGQKYRILKPFCTGARLEYDLEGLVGTCIEILGVDGGGESWFHEYDDGRKDWLFHSDVKIGCVELMEEEDILKQKLEEYGFKNSDGILQNRIFAITANDGQISVIHRPKGYYIKFEDCHLEQLIVALTTLLEDK